MVMISLFTLLVVVPTVVSVGIAVPAGIVGVVGDVLKSSPRPEEKDDSSRDDD
jgi:hypothetical protein